MSKLNKMNSISIAIIACLYVLNNQVLKNIAFFPQCLHLFLVCYFNDIMAGFGMIAYSNILLSKVNNVICNILATIIVSLCMGIIWEFFAPIIKNSAVFDPYDFLCYALGSFLYWGLIGRRYDRN